MGWLPGMFVPNNFCGAELFIQKSVFRFCEHKLFLTELGGHGKQALVAHNLAVASFKNAVECRAARAILRPMDEFIERNLRASLAIVLVQNGSARGYGKRSTNHPEVQQGPSSAAFNLATRHCV